MLPTYATPYVDRAGMLARVVAGVTTGEPRVVAIVGPPGAGKTRLAVEVLREVRAAFATGAVAFADLRTVGAGEATARLARALGLRATSADAIRRALAAIGPAVVVVDDAELHLTELAPLIDGLADALPALRILVTSRERPDTRNGRVIELPPLTKPGSASEIERSEAGLIYLARMRRERVDYTVGADEGERVHTLLARLGDLPLAVEVIAAEAALFGTEALVARLDRPLAWLASGRGRAAHEGSALVDALAGSAARLEPAHRLALVEATLFASPFTATDAEAVLSAGPAAMAVLRALRARSWLVEVRDDRGVRFDILAPIREILADRYRDLEEAIAAARERHAAHFLDVARYPSDARGPALEDVFAAIQHASIHAARHPTLVAALRAMWEPARADGRVAAYARLAQALSQSQAASVEPVSRVLALEAFARAARESGRFAEAEEALASAEREARASGADDALDQVVCCRAGLAFKMGRYQVLAELASHAPKSDHADDAEAFAMGAAIRGEHDLAAQTYGEAIARAERARDDARAAVLTACAARFHVEHGDHSRVARYLERLTARAANESAVGASIVTTRALAAHDLGDLEAAVAGYDEALAHYARLGSPLVAYLAQVRALATLASGHGDQALAAFRAARIAHVSSMAQLAPLAALGDWLLDDLVPSAAPIPDRVVATTYELVAAFVATRASPAAADRLAAAQVAHVTLERWSVVSRALSRFVAKAALELPGAFALPGRKGEQALLVDPQHRWFATPRGPVVSIATRAVLQRVLAALVDARLAEPGSRVSLEDIAARAWPGEQILPTSRRARVYVAISTLRQLGLDELLQSADNGYRLEPSVPCTRQV